MQQKVERLANYFSSAIIPHLKGHYNLKVSHRQQRRDLLDIDILQNSDPVAEMRIDLLESPSTLHLFIHQYAYEKPLKKLLLQNLHPIEKILGKRIIIDSRHSDASQRVSEITHRIAQEVDELRKELVILTKTHHSIGFPKYGYGFLPKPLKKFNIHLPTSLTLEISSGRFLPKAAMKFQFDNLHDRDIQTLTISLPPRLHKEVIGRLKGPLDRFTNRIGSALKKSISVKYLPLERRNAS